MENIYFDGSVERCVTTSKDPEPPTLPFWCSQSFFSHAWSSIILDHWILEINTVNCSAQFYTVPIPTTTLYHEDLFSQEVLSLLSLSMMERVILHYHGTGFYSKYFLIPKKKEG